MSPPPDPSTATVERAEAHPEKSGRLDGIPHDVMGILAVGCVLLAAATVAGYLLSGVVLAALVAVTGAALGMRSLVRRSRRERTEEAGGGAVPTRNDANDR